ncbi:MAG: gamma-glutamylcyclotransferase [Roseinatronobacter sp.]|nr:gamma-glutamylcyclotransferase [Roseinatronobacter sp.]
MTDGFFFGYGSLVNRQTHAYADTSPATIRGWRREWRKSFAYGQTFLSVVPDASAQIDGLVARVPGGDWGALDLREAGYQRLPLPADQITTSRAVTAQIYAVAQEDSALPGQDAPVTLSYLDVVVEGFMTEFGAAGVARFFDSTTGWAAVLDDRTAPLYPRARPVTMELRDMTDSYLDKLGVFRLRA